MSTEATSTEAMKRPLLRFLPLIILLVAGAGFGALLVTRQAPERKILPDLGPLVEAIAAPPQALQVIIEAQGSVRPADEIDLVPQVSGIVIWTAPQLESGGFFARDDVLLRIDPRDYDLAVTRSEAAVARARYALDLARQEAEAAQQEWELVRTHRSIESEPSDLVLRRPQVRAAEAELQAAQAGLAEARLRLERTHITAPFDGRVRDTSLDAGQYVVANQPVARVYSIERAEIVVAVPHQDMAWLDIPRRSSGPTRVSPPANRAEGLEQPPPLSVAPSARVQAQFAGREHTWDGVVARAAAELDARSRMLNLVVQVDGPYDNTGDSSSPLLVGMFVDVQIFGATVEDVRVLPRVALHEGDIVWVAAADGTLRMRQAQVVHVRDEEILVRLQLATDERIITSQLSGATEGMKIRLHGLAMETRP